jgi:hypothetical protein
MFPLASTTGSPLFTIVPIAPGKPSEVPTTVVPVVPVVLPPVETVVVVLLVALAPVVGLTVAAPRGALAEASWLAAVLALARSAWAACAVAAARWSVVVVLVGVVEADEPVEPDEPDEEAAGAVDVRPMPAGALAMVPLLVDALDEVPDDECTATAAGRACAITGAANSTATRRASEAAGVGLRIDVSLCGGISKIYRREVACLGC